MTAKKKKIDFKKVKGLLPYLITGVLTLGLVFVGSIDKQNSDVNLSLSTFAEKDYQVSVDQMSELYVVADLSDALGLASASDVASNYVITTTMYDSGQTSVGKLEKPNLTNINASRGVLEHTVADGETVESLASKYGVTADQIRWSNGLKTTDVAVGTVLYIPSTPGIVYVVKSGDTIESIVDKYGSTSEEIIALNDLEFSGIEEGTRILIKDGSLPERERPEYVAPVVRPTYTAPTTTYTYTYLGNTSERQNIEVVGWFYNLGGPYGAGQCTQWAWYNRQDLPSNLGNANAWARNAAAMGYVVNRTPSAGAIIQTSSGWYGHVGYVEAVNPDGSIVMSEMNYGIPYRVIRSTIPASSVGNFNYIH
ncbi:LysM peptidoglycan-binding domain-containing protein [Candidatus Saccharibacteria bacterium]|nr:LysM peptidoglycan-binding domain-containing protein [Candidatus Saccharibacteria bacterium]